MPLDSGDPEGAGNLDPTPQPLPNDIESRSTKVGLSYDRLLNSAEGHVQHWTTYNATLGATPLKLRGNIAVADLQTAITTMQTLQVAVKSSNIGNIEGSKTLHDKKSLLLVRVTQLRKAIDAQIGNSNHLAAAPNAPQLSANRSRFVGTLNLAKDVWTRVNADTTVAGFTPPLLLLGGYTLATFTTDIIALETAYTAHSNVMEIVKDALQKRNKQMATVLGIVVLYRKSIGARFAPTDPTFLSLPRLYPPTGGTPNAVTDLLYTLNADKTAANITFTPSTSANIDHYDARFSPGEKYDATNEETLATVQASDNPHSITVPVTAIAAGGTGLVKIYTVNKTDNEKGSKVLKIKRV